MEALTRTAEGHPAITVPVRVRYAECDPQGVAHHAAYPVWLEIARTELLRAMGKDYKAVEAEGLMCVVARMSLRYRRPAFYDDVLSVECVATKTRGVKLEHVYRVVRSDEVLTEAETTLVCVDREGRVRPVPEDWG